MQRFTASHVVEPLTPRLLRTKDAAAYLGMKSAKLRELVLREELRPVVQAERGEPWLFDILDLDNWVERQRARVSA